MADAYYMVHVTQCELEKLVRQYARGICKSEQGMVGKDGSKSHSPGMKYCFVTEVTQTRMSVHYFNLFSNDNVAEDGKK